MITAEARRSCAESFAETGRLVTVIGDAGRPIPSAKSPSAGPTFYYSAFEAALGGWED